MTIEEYTAAITEMINNPEGAGEKGASIIEALKADDEARSTLASQVEAQKKTIADLNSKIFMTQTGQGKQEEEHEETPRETFNRLFDERFYPEDKK